LKGSQTQAIKLNQTYTSYLTNLTACCQC